MYIDFQYTVEFFHRDLVWAMFSNVRHPECVKLGRKGSWSKKRVGGTVVYALFRARAGPIDFCSVIHAGLRGPCLNDPNPSRFIFIFS